MSSGRRRDARSHGKNGRLDGARICAAGTAPRGPPDPPGPAQKRHFTSLLTSTSAPPVTSPVSEKTQQNQLNIIFRNIADRGLPPPYNRGPRSATSFSQPSRIPFPKEAAAGVRSPRRPFCFCDAGARVVDRSHSPRTSSMSASPLIDARTLRASIIIASRASDDHR